MVLLRVLGLQETARNKQGWSVQESPVVGSWSQAKV